MELFTSVGDIIIFIAAIIGAITAIWKFFANGGKGIKKKVEENKAQQKANEEQYIRDVIAKVQEDMSDWNVLWDPFYKSTISIKDSMRDTYAGQRGEFLLFQHTRQVFRNTTYDAARRKPAEFHRFYGG